MEAKEQRNSAKWLTNVLSEVVPSEIAERIKGVSSEDLQTGIMALLAFSNLTGVFEVELTQKNSGVQQRIIDELIKEKKEIERRLARIESTITSKRDEYKILEDEYKILEDEYNTLEKKYKKLKKEQRLPEVVTDLEKRVDQLSREDRSLRKKVEEARIEFRHVRANSRYAKAMSKITVFDAFRIGEAFRIEMPLFANQGIYILTLEDHVVYVGQSVRACSRIADHWYDDSKEFDSVYFVPVEDRNSLNGIEAYYIHNLKPTENGHIPSCSRIVEPPPQYRVRGAVILSDSCDTDIDLSWSKRSRQGSS